MPLLELVQRAVDACNSRGPVAAAERLILFPRVVEALQRCADQAPAAARVRGCVRRLNACLRDIEVAQSEQGPSHEHVRAYYGAVIDLQRALRDLE